MRQPHSSPLFPDTTLFRSRLGRGDSAGGAPAAAVRGGGREAASRVRPAANAPALPDLRVGAVHIRGDQGGDRKSTRLNSSHANISYAVFCLKKNTNNHSHP